MCIAGSEPALDDMLSDPMTQALMASDGVEAKEIKTLLVEARARSGRATTADRVDSLAAVRNNRPCSADGPGDDSALRE